MNPIENEEMSYERIKEDIFYHYNLAELNKYISDNLNLNVRDKEKKLNSCKSNDIIFNKLSEYNIYNNENYNQKIVGFNDYEFINPNEIEGDDTTDDNLYNLIMDHMEKNFEHSDNEKRISEIDKMDNKN